MQKFFDLDGSHLQKSLLEEGAGNVYEIVTISDKGGIGVIKSMTSHILVKIKTCKISRLNFEITQI